jgi:cytochrome c peroxidase
MSREESRWSLRRKVLGTGAILVVLVIAAFIGHIVLASAAPQGAQKPNAGQPPASPPTASQPQGTPAQFAATMKRMSDARPRIMKAAQDRLAQRYDLANRPAKNLTMTRGKAVQEGVRVKLPNGVTWDRLAAMAPAEIRSRNLFPQGFMPLPHPNHPEGGMIFPRFHIDEVRRQTNRDLTRFDLDMDFPDHVMPEFPPAMFLTTRPELGDVSKGQLVTLDNFYDLFSGILNPKQLEGLRLLLTPFPQQQFNITHHRRSARPSEGVSCFDCHANGHTNGGTHLVGDIRPQEARNRVDTPSLRGVNVQRLFGSQRALKTVEDFTEFEQRAAYFDGDLAQATAKGINVLDRGAEVHPMGEFQALLDFPPAPKLDLFGRLDPAQATQAELRGQEIFFGKGQCSTCHIPPYYTDNLMHNLRLERFYQERLIAGHLANAEGPIKTFPLRGLKDSPPYFHDGRLITIEDTVELFNLILGTKLTAAEKADLVAFLRVL